MRWMVSNQVVKTEVVDANEFIGERDCKLRPGYKYDNSKLKLLIITPKKKPDGSLHLHAKLKWQRKNQNRDQKLKLEMKMQE